MFRIGDEVECVDAKNYSGSYWNPPVEGAVYSVAGVGRSSGRTVLFLGGHPNPCLCHNKDYGFRASRFRKVQKRNDRLTIEAFSVIKDGGFEEPKRIPAKKRERVQ